ncbi:zinc-ribbon domain-containing protein [bacterium]|nr:zinc-ribbon domain-containing protein [bacterium]
MIIACPNCSTQYKIDPARFRERTITFRCRKCERMIKFDKDALKDKQKDEGVTAFVTVSHTPEDALGHNQVSEQGLHPDDSFQIEPDQTSSGAVIEQASPVPDSEPTSSSAILNQPLRDLGPGRRKNILVADDEMSICIMIEEILTNAGYNVTIALDGLEAYEKVRSEKPDLVILDLLMPKMTGFEVLKEIRKENKDVPVLVMTAIYKKASQVLVVKELGANGYLEKPFSPDHLLFRIENLLMAAAQQ